MKKHLEQLKKEFQDANLRVPNSAFVSVDDFNEMNKLGLLDFNCFYGQIAVFSNPALRKGEYITNIPQKFKD